MAQLRTYPLPNSAILRLNSEREYIKVDPPYQRNGDVWTIEKKQLLIDSILNDYDIPKLYFHALSLTQQKEYGGQFDFSIIDGRQRLETIWSFIDGKFALSSDFEYFADETVRAASLTYSALAEAYPRLKIRFDSFTLPVVCVETEEISLIEDMFSRLNEAVPLNAAEKRAAFGGPMAQCINEVAQHVFFKTKVRFSDSRYQHREVSARLLFLEYSQVINGKIIDTKKPYLDDMVQKFRQNIPAPLGALRARTVGTLDLLVPAFADEDALLRAQAAIPVFYLVMQAAEKAQQLERFRRDELENFFERIRQNRMEAERDIASANFEWLEYDRMSQQGTNDASSLRERVRILCEFLGIEVGGIQQAF